MRRPCVGLVVLLTALLAVPASFAQEKGPVERWRERAPITSDSVDITVEEPERMDPVQRVYGKWGEEVVRCLQQTGYADSIRLRQGVRVWTASYIAKNGRSGAGLWLAPKTIVVLEQDVASERVIKHELAHVYCQPCPHPVIKRCAIADACLKAGGV